MAGSEVKLAFVGDATRLTKAMDKAGAGAKEMAADLDKAEGEAKKFGKAVDSAGGAIDASESKFMGTADILDGLATTMGFNIDGAINMARGFGDIAGGMTNTVVPAVQGLLAKLGFMTAATGAQTVATEGAAVAQSGLNIAMLANPIGAVVLAIVALVAIFVVLWNKVDGFRDAIKDAWHWVENSIPGFKQLGDAIGWVKGMFSDAGEKAEEVTKAMQAHANEIDAAILILNNGVGVNRQAWEDWSKDVQSQVADVLNPIKRFEMDTDLTMDKVLETLKLNQADFEAWSRNLGTIAQRGGQNFALELQAMGPQAAQLVHELAGATDKEFRAFENKFIENGRLIGGAGARAVQESIANGNWAALGRNVGDQLGVNTAAQYMAVMEQTLIQLKDAGATVGVAFATATTGHRAAYVPKRQHGGPVWPGQPFLVGERGPELFVPGQVGYVAPGRMGGSGGQTINIVVNGWVGDDVALTRKIAAALGEESARGTTLGLS